MKLLFKTLIISLLLTPNLQAANMSNMEGMNMQQMMLQMQKMQQCLMQVDEAELRQYEAKINRLEPELRSLCQQGKRDQAQQKAIEFGKEIAKSNAVKVIQSCTKDMQSNAFMPAMPDFDNLDGRHICDELNN